MDNKDFENFIKGTPTNELDKAALEQIKLIEDQDKLWITVVVECSYVESEGVWKVIKRLQERFTITRKLS